jgi:tetratricopeptide (TPR) repeat protein
MSKAEREFHRKTAAESFNRAWDYLEKKNRTQEDDREMLTLAHASRYHWGQVGTRENQAVGEWQLSRIYADLGQQDLALRFAMASLSTCKVNNLLEIMPSAYEGVARAYAAGGDSRKAERYLAKAREQLKTLTLDKDDRKIYLGQIKDTQRLIDKL